MPVNGVLHLSQPQERHGARLPFDFLLRSLAQDCGSRAVCVVLSGSGADGSLGLKAVRQAGGLIIAQDSKESGHDGMPRSAITTGLVDLVLPVAEIPGALATCNPKRPTTHARGGAVPQDDVPTWLPEIVDLLRVRTSHDFTLYKPGTLHRRVERRMAMAGIPADGVAGYLKMLQSNPTELDCLATDLLINVTSAHGRLI